VTQLLAAQHYALGNADITVVAQEPRLAPYIPHMVQALAAAVEQEPGRMSVKATTTDGLGFTGQGAGIAAYAVCLVCPR
jgi:2-C-methyl-D-erythritol 2,4-cyclodiphosphate synthase